MISEARALALGVLVLFAIGLLAAAREARGRAEQVAYLREEVDMLRVQTEAVRVGLVALRDARGIGGSASGAVTLSVDDSLDFDDIADEPVAYVPPLLRPPWRERTGDACTCYRDVPAHDMPGVVALTFATPCPCEGPMMEWP